MIAQPAQVPGTGAKDIGETNGVTKYKWGRLKLTIFGQYLAVSRKHARQERGYYGRLTATRMHFIEWCYFQWSWVTPNYPKPSHFLLFAWYFLSSSVRIEISNLVCWLTTASLSCGCQTTPERAGHGHMTNLKFCGPRLISVMAVAKAIESSNFVHRYWLLSSVSLRMTTYLQMGVVRVTLPIFLILETGIDE